jgi:predicted esterase
VLAQSNTQLITFQKRTLRIRPATGKTPRLLVLVHGLTGDENSMWVFAKNFSEDCWIVAPRAPHSAELAGGGYSWRPLQPGLPGEEQNTPTIEELRPAAEMLILLMDAYTDENHIQAGQFDMIGFSQGGALTNTIALLHPERIRRAGVLAGFIPMNAGALIQERPLKGKPFFVAHGRLDERVMIQYARESVEMLEAAGARVTFCEDEVGHKVSANCLRALEDFFSK